MQPGINLWHMDLLAVIKNGTLKPTFQDSDFGAWISITGYFLCAATVWIVHRKTCVTRSQSTLWFSLGTLILLFSLNRQIDLDLELVAFLKGRAKDQGWYEYRRMIAVAGAVLFLTGAALACWKFRRDIFQSYSTPVLILAGLLLLSFHVILRMATLHWVEPWSGFHLGCPTTNPIFEWAGLGLLFAGMTLKILKTPVVKVSGAVAGSPERFF